MAQCQQAHAEAPARRRHGRCGTTPLRAAPRGRQKKTGHPQLSPLASPLIFSPLASLLKPSAAGSAAGSISSPAHPNACLVAAHRAVARRKLALHLVAVASGASALNGP